MNYKERVCVSCDEVFKPTSPKQKACVKKECIVSVRRASEKNRYYKNKEVLDRVCPVCKGEFKTTNKNKRYCGAVSCEKERVGLKEVVKVVKEVKEVKSVSVVKEQVQPVFKVICKPVQLSLGNTDSVDVSSCVETYSYSSAMKKLLDFVKDLIGLENVVENVDEVVPGYTLEIFAPQKKLAIEFCDFYSHSEVAGCKEKSYHYDKMMACFDKGIRLITIFEDEFTNRPDVVLSRIKNALGCSDRTVFARKCHIKEITYQQALAFLTKYHLQGSSMSSMRFGLFFEGELLQVMTFGHLSRTHTQIKGKKTSELKRFACIPGISVVGGASKLFKHALKYLVPDGFEYVKSYCDMRFANAFNTVYKKMGFELLCFTKYTPHYLRLEEKKRYRNQGLRKTPEERLTGLTEWELRKRDGYDRLYDCGHYTFTFEIK